MEGTTEKEYSDFKSMTFTFDLYACNKDGVIDQDAEAIDTVTASNKEEAMVKFSFSKLSYSHTDVPKGQTRTFYYLIKERVPEGGKAGDVNYDAKPVHVEVVATDDGSGNISLSFRPELRTTMNSWSDWEVIQAGGTDTDKVYAIGNFDNTYEEQKVTTHF